jgi:hypothetical protein
MGWLQIPDGLVARSCTSHPGVLGSIPKREEPGKTGAPCFKVPGSSRVPVHDGQTCPHRPRLVVSNSTFPALTPSPHANVFILGTAVINNNFKSSTIVHPRKQLYIRYCCNKQHLRAIIMINTSEPYKNLQQALGGHGKTLSFCLRQLGVPSRPPKRTRERERERDQAEARAIKCIPVTHYPDVRIHGPPEAWRHLQLPVPRLVNSNGA